MDDLDLVSIHELNALIAGFGNNGAIEFNCYPILPDPHLLQQGRQCTTGDRLQRIAIYQNLHGLPHK